MCDAVFKSGSQVCQSINLSITTTGCAERIPEFIAWMGRRGRKPKTLEGLGRGARRCCETLDALFPGIALEDVGEEEVAMLQADLLSRYRTRSARTYMQALGAYSKWLAGRDVVEEARLMWNSEGVERLWIARDEYRALYREAGPRERVMLALGATMGLRREEIMTLELSQIRDGGIESHGKGHGPNGKVEWRPMSGSVRKALDEWMPVRSEIVAETGTGCCALILSRKGTPVAPNQMNRVLDTVGRRAGIKVTPHSLRRLFAMTMDDAGTDLETMARMMRHNSPETTMQCYLKADPRKMEAASSAVDRLMAARRTYYI